MVKATAVRGSKKYWHDNAPYHVERICGSFVRFKTHTYPAAAAEQGVIKSLKNCFKKIFKLRGAKLPHKFLQNYGYLPAHEAKKKFMACISVGFIDKHNTNIAAHSNNARKEVLYGRKST